MIFLGMGSWLERASGKGLSIYRYHCCNKGASRSDGVTDQSWSVSFLMIIR